MRGYAYTSERGSSSSPKTSSPRRATVCSCIGSLKSSSPHHLKSVQDAPERGRAVYARRKAQVIGLGFSSPHAVMRSVAFLLLSFEALEFPCGKIHHPRRGGGRLYWLFRVASRLTQIGDMLFIIERGVCDACKLLNDHEVG